MLTAPYTSAMRLGQGWVSSSHKNLLLSLTNYEPRFNSYNHEVCVNDAVIIDSENPGGDIYGGSDTTISQIVSYCTRHVDKVSQVIAAMNISAAASVKTAGGGGGLAGSYIDSDTFKESNINFFCQVKVTNQVIMGADLLKFNDIPTFRAEDSAHFTKVYGDSFISGFIEGGELNAIISIKTSDKKTINSIKASLEGSFGKGKFSADIKGEGGKEDTQALSQSETTITVNWTGGKSDSRGHPFSPSLVTIILIRMLRRYHQACRGALVDWFTCQGCCCLPGTGSQDTPANPVSPNSLHSVIIYVKLFLYLHMTFSNHIVQSWPSMRICGHSTSSYPECPLRSTTLSLSYTPMTSWTPSLTTRVFGPSFINVRKPVYISIYHFKPEALLTGWHRRGGSGIWNRNSA